MARVHLKRCASLRSSREICANLTELTRRAYRGVLSLGLLVLESVLLLEVELPLVPVVELFEFVLELLPEFICVLS